MTGVLVLVATDARSHVTAAQLLELAAVADVTVAGDDRVRASLAQHAVRPRFLRLDLDPGSVPSASAVDAAARSSRRLVRAAISADLLVAADDRAVLAVWELARLNSTAPARHGLATAVRVVGEVPSRSPGSARIDLLRHLTRSAVRRARRRASRKRRPGLD